MALNRTRFRMVPRWNLCLHAQFGDYRTFMARSDKKLCWITIRCSLIWLNPVGPVFRYRAVFHCTNYNLYFSHIIRNFEQRHLNLTLLRSIQNSFVSLYSLRSICVSKKFVNCLILFLHFARYIFLYLSIFLDFSARWLFRFGVSIRLGKIMLDPSNPWWYWCDSIRAIDWIF